MARNRKNLVKEIAQIIRLYAAINPMEESWASSGVLNPYFAGFHCGNVQPWLNASPEEQALKQIDVRKICK